MIGGGGGDREGGMKGPLKNACRDAALCLDGIKNVCGGLAVKTGIQVGELNDLVQNLSKTYMKTIN